MHFYRQNTQCYEYIYIYSEYLKRKGLDIITEELFLSCYIFFILSVHSTGAENQWGNKSPALSDYTFRLCQFA